MKEFQSRLAGVAMVVFGIMVIIFIGGIVHKACASLDDGPAAPPSAWRNK